MCHAFLRNTGRNRTIESGKNLNLLEGRKLEVLGNTDTIKQAEVKKKKKKKRKKKRERKEHLRRMRKLLETQLCIRNLIREINIRTAPFVRNSGPFLKWTKQELRQIDQRRGKLMTVHKALHPRDDIENCLCQEKKEEESSASRMA